MIGFPLALNQEHTGKVIAPAIITGSCIQLLGTSPDVVADYVGPFLLPAGDFHGPGSYISYVNTGGSWIGTAELVDFGGNVIATATVSGAGSGFIQVPFDNNVNIPSDTLCYLRFTNTDSGAGVLTWYFEVVRAGALPVITTPPTLTWTSAHGTSPVITEGTYVQGTHWVYDLIRSSTKVLDRVSKAEVEAYVSDRTTDVGPTWFLNAYAGNGSGLSTPAASNVIAYHPQTVPNYYADFDADDGAENTISNPATDGQTIERLLDQGPNALHLLQSTSNNRPRFETDDGPNGHARIAFDQVTNAKFMDNAGFSRNQPLTVFTIARMGAANTTAILYDGIGADRIVVYKSSTNFFIFAGAGVGNTGLPTGWFLDQAIFNGASSSHRLNAAAAVTGNPGANSWGGLRLGGGTGTPSTTTSWVGDVSRWIIFDAILSDSNRDDVRQYLAYHYGVSV